MFRKVEQWCFEAKSLKTPSSNKTSSSSNETIEFLSKQERFFFLNKIICAENFGQSSSAEVVEASYEIAQMIAQAKKPHNIGETLIKPGMLKASSLVSGESNGKKFAKISPSDSTIKTRIDELANDIECQVLQQIQASPYFAIQCDETTYVA